MDMPLSFSPIAATSSIAETEVLFADQLAQSRIMSAETGTDFSVEMNGVPLGPCLLSVLHHHSGYEIDCGDIDNEDSIVFGYGSGGQSVTFFDGAGFVASENGLVITNHLNVRHTREAGSYEFLLRCTRDALMQRLQASLDRHVSKTLLFEQTVSLNAQKGIQARFAIDYVLQSLESNQAILDNPLIMANFEELLLNAILSLPNNYSNQLDGPVSACTAPAVVIRSEAFMEENVTQPITLSDVLEHVACSRNTLFKNFKKFRGYTPLEFLFTKRLELTRERLLAAQEEDTVTSIAMNMGFSHMGRFSNMYQARYGEMPSQTLRRRLS
ncbi:MAG: helix-turn-helix transcriptional regulator [Halioglobus sp.]